MIPIEVATSRFVAPEKQKTIELESFHDGYVFRVDYAPDTPDKVMDNDLRTYLGEYRLQLQKDTYELQYSRGLDGQLGLRSSDDGESMLTIGKRGIAERLKTGKSVKKETADLLGMERLEAYLQNAEDGDTLLWASPADPEVGYEYGFLYVGSVKSVTNAEKKVSMQAIRVDNNPELSSFNTALSLLKQDNVAFTAVNDFIAHPIHLERNVSEQELSFVLHGVFGILDDAKTEQRKQQVLTRLQPHFTLFKQAVRSGASRDERRSIVFALENMALIIDQQLEQEALYGERSIFTAFDHEDSERLVERYGYEPPKVVGSCDAQGYPASPAIFGYTSLFMSSPEVYHHPMLGERTLKCQKCPLCQAPDIVATIAFGKITCPSCKGSAPYNC